MHERFNKEAMTYGLANNLFFSSFMTNCTPNAIKNNPDKRKPTFGTVGVKHFAPFDVNITILYIRKTIDEIVNK
jgi:hypothetical protein